MANIILPQVNILNEIDDSTKLIVEQNGEINRYPIADLELGGGDVTIDLSGDNVGEATGINATLLGGYPAEDYAKTIDIDNMLEIDLYGASAAEPNLVNADTLGGFGPDYFASVEEMNEKLSIELLWENASPNSEFAAQTISLNLSLYRFIYIRFKVQSTISDIDTILTIPNGDDYWITSASYYSCGRNANVNQTGIIFNDGKKYTTYASSSTVDNERMIPITIHGIK